jgi:histidyl-tRNA synthetase
MMVKRIKGMYDILPPDGDLWGDVERRFMEMAAQHGFHDVRTPILEHTDLFSRSIGEATDIVEKEMFTFPDRHGKNLSLRPEGTASMVRAYIENKVAQVDPVAKWAYRGPMYRYERPQKGRNRQFFQLGAEVFGIAGAHQDAELIALGWRFLTSLDPGPLSLEINSLGNADERAVYREKLVGYLHGYEPDLCDDCRRRLTTNPMRVLDCKNERCSVIGTDAPKMLEHLQAESAAHFETVKEMLTRLSVPFAVNTRIVRGLDYYNRTAFEFKAGALGAQDAVGGGGRYDALVASLGGPDTPAVGFALGLDRLMLLLEGRAAQVRAMDFYFVPMGDAATGLAMELADRLRGQGLMGEVDFTGRRLKHLFARAERLGARFALILGDAELEQGLVNVKRLGQKEQAVLKIDELNAERLESI